MPAPRFQVRAACAMVAAAQVLVRPAAAQGRTAAPLLQMPASARAAAMGDAYGPEPGTTDAATSFYNPAQIAGLAGTGATLSVERYLSSTTGAFALAHQAGRVAIGGGLLALQYPDAEEVVADPGGETGSATGATIDGREIVAGLALAVGDARRRAGVMTKYVGQFLPGASGGALAVDVGVAGRVAHSVSWDLQMAAAAQNMGAELATGTTHAPLPRAWRTGTQLSYMQSPPVLWTAVVELVGTRDLPVALRTGLEGEWIRDDYSVAARAGWATQPDGAATQPLTLGAGLEWRGLFWLDYAWRRFGVLGSTHRLGVRWYRTKERIRLRTDAQ